MDTAKLSAATIFALVSGSVLMTPAANAIINFRLQTMTVMEDGFNREHSYFQADAENKIMIDLPRGWSTSSDEASITTAPQDIQNSQVKLERSRLTPNIPFKDKSLDLYKAVAQKSVPEGAVGTEFLAPADQPLPIFRWTDYEFFITYQFFGQSYKRSVLFINLNTKDQIVITAIAPAKDFDRVHAATLDIARSWTPVEHK